MATELTDLLQQQTERAENVRAPSYYQREAAALQANRADAAALKTEAQLAIQGQRLNSDIADMQRRNTENQYQQGKALIDYGTKVAQETELANESNRNVRDAARSDMDANLERMEKINEQRDKTKNPIAKIIHGIRYNMARNEHITDVERHNASVDIMNKRYQEAAFKIQQYKSTEYMQNALTYQRQSALEAIKLGERSKTLQQVQAVSNSISQRTNNMFVRTGLDPDRDAKKLVEDPYVKFFHHMSGNGDLPLTSTMSKGYAQYANDLGPEARAALGRAVMAWNGAYERGEVLGPEDMLGEFVRNGTAQEVSGLARLFPDLASTQIVNGAVEGLQTKVNADATATIAKKYGVKQGDNGEFQFTPDQQEEIRQLTTTSMNRTLASTSGQALVKDHLQTQLNGFSAQVLDPSGADINTNIFVENREFLDQVLPKYNIAPDQFTRVMANDELRAVMNSASNDNNGLYNKRLIMEQYLVDEGGMKPTEAAELTSEAFQTYYLGKALSGNEYYYSMYQLIDGTPDFQVVAPVKGVGQFAKTRNVNILDPAAVANEEARAKAEEQRTKAARARSLDLSRELDPFSSGFTGGLGQ